MFLRRLDLLEKNPLSHSRVRPLQPCTTLLLIDGSVCLICCHQDPHRQKLLHVATCKPRDRHTSAKVCQLEHTCLPWTFSHCVSTAVATVQPSLLRWVRQVIWSSPVGVFHKQLLVYMYIAHVFKFNPLLYSYDYTIRKRYKLILDNDDHSCALQCVLFRFGYSVFCSMLLPGVRLFQYDCMYSHFQEFLHMTTPGQRQE